MRYGVLLVFLFLAAQVYSQDFFESLESPSGKMPYELNGYMRGAFFGGKDLNGEELAQKSGYGELALKMRVRKAEWGDGFAEVRFRKGYEFDESLSELEIREAYVDVYKGRFDMRLGQQIVVWGRADGFNPTNNITPQNMLTRSSVEDDRRMGNFLFRGHYNLRPLNLELIWVPEYRPSVLPTFLFPFPDYVTLGPTLVPNSDLKNSSVAAKLDLGLSAVGASVSYFRGYMPLPGVYPAEIGFVDGALAATIVNRPYRMQVFGGDFATTLGSIGLRGEVAYRDPVADYTKDVNVHVPNPDVQYVFGLDRTFGHFSIILQYIGRYVFDFKEFNPTGLPTDQLFITNRMVAGQQDEISHAAFMRPSLALMHETLDLEMLAYYNLTTEEMLLRPMMTYDITDALTFKLGADMYAGPDNTLFGNIDNALSSVFVELGVFF